MHWLWAQLLHVLGVDNAAGRWYSFWSGFAGDIPLFGVFIVMWRRHQCHIKGCRRIVWKLEGDHALCKRHHPEDEPTEADIATRS